jgi:membrane protein implicated in regulation of membrane protease activity
VTTILHILEVAAIIFLVGPLIWLAFGVFIAGQVWLQERYPQMFGALFLVLLVYLFFSGRQSSDDDDNYRGEIAPITTVAIG